MANIETCGRCGARFRSDAGVDAICPCCGWEAF